MNTLTQQKKCANNVCRESFAPQAWINATVEKYPDKPLLQVDLPEGHMGELETYVCPACKQEHLGGTLQTVTALPVSFSFEMTEKDIVDILVGALDPGHGGALYWAKIKEIHHPTTTREEFKANTSVYITDYIYDAIKNGGYVHFVDREGSGEEGKLTLESLYEGISLFCRHALKISRFIPLDSHLGGYVWEGGQIDAEGSDVLLQYAVFKDIIFG